MTEIEKVREYFEFDVFATGVTGIKIEEIAERYALCTLELDSRHKNAANQVMGGVIFTLADFTFAVSANRPNCPVTVTTNANVSFIGRVMGDRLIAESKLLKDGKRTCFYEISVKDDKNNLIAIVTVTGTKL